MITFSIRLVARKLEVCRDPWYSPYHVTRLRWDKPVAHTNHMVNSPHIQSTLPGSNERHDNIRGLCGNSMGCPWLLYTRLIVRISSNHDSLCVNAVNADILNLSYGLVASHFALRRLE